jgi:hypothetical protein
MTGARVYPSIVGVFAIVLAGCGSSERPTLAPPAEARKIELGWLERSQSPALVYRVDRLVIREDGWSADVGVENRSAFDFQIRRPHRPRDSLFGLVLLESASGKEIGELTAGFRKEPPFLEPDRIDPPLPGSLRAGARWRGTLTGSTVLRRGTVVRVIFGRFQRDQKPRVITWVTDHAVRL